MRKYKAFKIITSYILVLIMILGVIPIMHIEATDDYLTEVVVDYDRDYLKWDSKYGPLYEVTLSTGELQGCTSADAKIISYSYEGNIVKVTVYSAELPEEKTYTMDLSDTSQYRDLDVESDNNEVNDPNNGEDTNNGEDIDENIVDEITYAHIDEKNNQLHFDTQRGPYYSIDLTNGNKLYCSSDNSTLDGPKGEVKAFSKNGNKITVTVISAELPREMTYIIEKYTAKTDKLGNHVEINKAENILRFDSIGGPHYELKLDTGKLISCSSNLAKVISYIKNEKEIKVVVYSEEMPFEVEYIIDINTLTVSGDESVKYSADTLDYYNVYENGVIEFDSSMGPWFSIDYKKGEICGCSSSGGKILDLKVVDNILNINVYSDEMPIEKTYSFDLSKNITEENEYGAGVGEFDGQDVVEYFNIFPYENTIEWDSQYGPYYKINLKNGEIIDCSSNWIFSDQEKAKVLFYSYYGDNITFTVYSSELPYEMTYMFNTKTQTQVCGVGKYDTKASEEEFDKILQEIFKGDYQGKSVDKDVADKIFRAKKDGKKVVAIVETSSMSQKRVDGNTYNKVEELIKDKGLKSIQYIDISVCVYADGELIGKITELTNPIDFTLEAADEVIDSKENYYVVRVHNDEMDVLETELDDNNGMTFGTDRFSTYVLVSGTIKDQVVDEPTEKDDSNTTVQEEQTNEDKTVDNDTNQGTSDKDDDGLNIIPIIIVIILVLGIVGAVVFVLNKKGIIKIFKEKSN